MTDGMNMTEKEAREIVAYFNRSEQMAGPQTKHSGLNAMDLYRAEAVLHGLSLGRKEAEPLLKAIREHHRPGSDRDCLNLCSALQDYLKERQNNG